MIHPAIMIAALEARRRGATGAEVAPLLLPLPGPAGAMFSAVSVVRSQSRLDRLAREQRALGVADLVKGKEKDFPETAGVVARPIRLTRAEREAAAQEAQVKALKAQEEEAELRRAQLKATQTQTEVTRQLGAAILALNRQGSGDSKRGQAAQAGGAARQAQSNESAQS